MTPCHHPCFRCTAPLTAKEPPRCAPSCSSNSKAPDGVTSFPCDCGAEEEAATPRVGDVWALGVAQWTVVAILSDGEPLAVKEGGGEYRAIGLGTLRANWRRVQEAPSLCSESERGAAYLSLHDARLTRWRSKFSP